MHRYGFVTFQNEEDAVKVLHDVSNCKFAGCVEILSLIALSFYSVRRVPDFLHIVSHSRKTKATLSKCAVIKKKVLFFKDAHLNVSWKPVKTAIFLTSGTTFVP